MHIRFLLCAIAFHPGSAPTGGHYEALMLQDGDVYVVDDGTTAVICDSEEFADSCHNSYLFFHYLLATTCMRTLPCLGCPHRGTCSFVLQQQHGKQYRQDLTILSRLRSQRPGLPLQRGSPVKYVCIHACMHVCVYAYIHTQTHMCVCGGLYVCRYIRMCTCICACMHACMYVHMVGRLPSLTSLNKVIRIVTRRRNIKPAWLRTLQP